MTASIAHEINQPLGAIVLSGNACLRMLGAEEPDLATIRTALQRMVDDGRRASLILSNIRSMLRQDRPEQVPVNVNDLVRGVLELARGELEQHHVSVHTEFCEDLPGIIGEPVPLQQVVLNLVMNAIEAMAPRTDRQRQLRVETRAVGPDGIRITVADNGTGIIAQDLDRIFDPFFTTKAHGMGMGLSICRSIVEAHGGRLSAAAGDPHGSVFTVQLPTPLTDAVAGDA